jgi:hypothetical protein
MSFGVIVAGRSPLVNWSAVSPEKMTTQLMAPGSVQEITFFMLPGMVLPPGTGAILYFQAPSGAWEILGSVEMAKPSGVFRTGWSTRGDMQAIPGIQLGVEITPLDTIRNLELTRSGFDDRFAYAHKVARDLYNYMASFSQPQNDMMLVPVNVFDQWMRRFESKYRRDPDFMMKDS